MTENRRQRDPAEQGALAAVRDGTRRDYLAFAEANGRLVVSDNPVATKARLLADSRREASLDPAGNVMIALRRRDLAELNTLAHGLMDGHGRLGNDRLSLGGREFAPGDRVVCRRNDTVLNVNNGTRGTVEAAETCGTPTPSQVTRARALPSNAPSSSRAPTRVCRSGGRSLSPAPANKPGST